VIELVLIKKSVNLVLLKHESVGCALGKAVDVIGTEGNTNTDFVTLDKLVVSVHVSVVRGVKRGVAEIVGVVYDCGDDIVHVLHDAERTEEHLVANGVQLV